MPDSAPQLLVHGQPEYSQNFKINTLFIGGDQVRQAVAESRADYTPALTIINIPLPAGCESRIVAMLEGGYNHSALDRSVVAFLKGLL